MEKEELQNTASDYEIVRHLIEITLKEINGGFDKNELAFLSMEGKNEGQIRDKIAWRLHTLLEQSYQGQYLVIKEWQPKIKWNRERVDLAILKMQSGNPAYVVALIEFKAQSIVRPEKWYLEEFAHDVVKMCKFAHQDKLATSADLYFVFLETGQGADDTGKPYSQMLASLKYTSNTQYGTPEQLHSEMKKHFEQFPSLAGQTFEQRYNRTYYGFYLQEDVPTNINTFEVQPLGEIHQFTSCLGAFIWGPVKPNNINILTKIID